MNLLNIIKTSHRYAFTKLYECKECKFNANGESLLIGRNEEWEALLPVLIDGGDAVLAVGAAHLSGETGVLRALERAGYEVSPF